ncbi:acyl-CoA-dependent ceramide synthase [Scheffersomyces amazonensis]|uniref:acyl-CoA-dependent ceramide synthase n=1 Tax=Scheffersomyces amazonensis TaxID=1078765 RepID=UPI00315CA65E
MSDYNDEAKSSSAQVRQESSSAFASAYRNRGSSVGKIDLGDTSSPGLSTIHTAAVQRRKSEARILELSKESKSDIAIVKKIYVGLIELSYRHTWVAPLIVLIFSFSAFYFSSPKSRIHLFLECLIVPSYYIEGTDQYGKGINDFYFVGFYSIFFTFLREFFMCLISRPLSIHFGIKKEDRIKRFMEQSYSIFYYGCSGPFGLWIMSRLPLWFFETTPFYTNFPHKTHDFYFKIYYLGQAAFWVQQVMVLILQLEKPRKDFKVLVIHHIVTIALIWTSYRFHFTWMGLAVYITMDVSDFFLATSMTMNYIKSRFTGPFLVMFVIVWAYLRHYINLKILYSVLTEFRTVGPWELNWETQQYKCWISQPIVFFLIGVLQIVNLYWFFLILRILWRYIVGGVARDERSDDESDSEEQS